MKFYNTIDFKQFKVTGYYANSSRKFKTITTNNWWYANGINLLKGRVWGILNNGKRVLLKRVGC